MTSSLPRSAPSAQGVDARGIAAFVDAVEAHPGIEAHSLMVLRHGHVVAEGWWAPYSADRVHLLYSLSKTFTAVALGFAVDEGLAGLDDAVADHFPFGGQVPAASRAIKVRHVAAMAAGHTREMIETAVATDFTEPVRGFLMNPPDREPGSVFAYSQPCTYSVGAIVQRESGQRLVDFLRPRLLDPLGVGPVAWQQYPAGRDIGFSGLHARTEDIAKLGQVLVDGGRWEGAPLLPEGWAGQMQQQHVATEGVETNPDWTLGYGFQMWRSRHGWRADGAYGQFCLVLPEQDAVVALTTATNVAQDLLDLVWQHLLPALTAGGADTAAETALLERLHALALPVVQGGAAIDDAAAGSFGVPIGDAQGMVESVGLVRRGDRREVVLRTPAGDLRAEVGEGRWAVTEADGQPPVAVSGAAAADGSLRVDVVLLETPHRLELELDPGERRARARWATEPLGLGLPDALLTLRAPW